jgi:hypothetical protein
MQVSSEIGFSAESYNDVSPTAGTGVLRGALCCVKCFSYNGIVDLIIVYYINIEYVLGGGEEKKVSALPKIEL